MNVRVLHLHLGDVDRMNAAVSAAQRQQIGEPRGACPRARADFEDRTRPQFGDQHRIGGEIENILHQRLAAPAHERRRALARQQNIGAEFGSETRVIVNRGSLAPRKLDKAALFPAVEEQPQSVQVPLKILRRPGNSRRMRLDAFFPGPLPVKAREPCQHPAKPAIENADKAALFLIDLGSHLAEKSLRRALQCVAGDEIGRLAHGRASRAAHEKSGTSTAYGLPPADA